MTTCVLVQEYLSAIAKILATLSTDMASARSLFSPFQAADPDESAFAKALQVQDLPQVFSLSSRARTEKRSAMGSMSKAKSASSTTQSYRISLLIFPKSEPRDVGIDEVQQQHELLKGDVLTTLEALAAILWILISEITAGPRCVMWCDASTWPHSSAASFRGVGPPRGLSLRFASLDGCKMM